MKRLPKDNRIRPAGQRNLADGEGAAAACEERLRARFARLDALPRRPFDEADMYDEQGLPK
jgi:hypothetical protein